MSNGPITKTRALLRDRPWGTAVALLMGAYALTILFDAWLADDAYITFRVVDNLIHGFGPVYNVGERVQAYTNPLMMLVVSAFAVVTREVYFTSLAVCVASSLAAMWVLAFKVARSRTVAVAAMLVLVFSSSFISYSTSGLENCLIFLLSALFFWVYADSERYSDKSLLLLTLLFSLSLVNRMDTALLLFPPLCFAYWRHDGVKVGRMVGVALLGLLPFIAWEAFAVIYYGFPFPNTAYAKLNTGVPAAEYVTRGIWYLRMTFWQDPVVVIGTLAGAVLVLFDRRMRTALPAIGVLLYLAYVVKIGGDFMRGRMLTAPLFVIMLVIVSIEPERWERLKLKPRDLVVGALAVLLVGVLGTSFYEGMSWEGYNPYGILNDKRLYYQDTNLAMNLRFAKRGQSVRAQEGLAYRDAGESPVVNPGIGLRGFYAGPTIHILDPLALSDALLARLPAIENPEWRVGHLWRYIPDGYRESIASGRNSIRDPQLARYYDRLRLVTSGPLWSAARWRAIIGLNTGAYDNLIDRDHYRFEVSPQYDFETFEPIEQ